ncbi:MULTISPECIES: DUF4870 domain-containing protein [Cellulophaga]|uniref:DUF4870 domain-containing protein n=2 Tax=Cellulophaga TaxID=104264 RepID=F0RH15_CELLC|nr:MULTISPECIES: DUF4870 domain-containing protein [Cellulophaga]ADY30219.1 hypothetical protein Celly_2402 [Cellulophaga lytica DSM 7489]AIM61212.1 hypothetical protein IX49_12000 [Cellulophaga lytica]APU11100.1 hypothetical protein A5M85_12650 [Cellulophaga lytica]EWH10965.1 hypothetical protein KLA_16190 [Cellulophaga geojensis KL-A]MDO6854140.1 DUF4870 domain-containing protein [Cellulophaga lytica]
MLNNELPEDYSNISLMHYSQLLNFLGPFGIIVPIIMWSSKKTEVKDMDAHGRAVINFQISVLIYSVVFFVLLLISMFLSLFIVGILFLFILFFVGIALALLMIITPIMGGMAASEKRLYKYPLSIKFI